MSRKKCKYASFLMGQFAAHTFLYVILRAISSQSTGCINRLPRILGILRGVLIKPFFLGLPA